MNPHEGDKALLPAQDATARLLVSAALPAAHAIDRPLGVGCRWTEVPAEGAATKPLYRGWEPTTHT